MRPCQRAILFILTVLLISGLSIPMEVSAYTVRPDHPRVFINSDNIADIRAKCSDPSGVQDEYYTLIKNWCDNNLDTTFAAGEMLGRRYMPSFAFCYVMGEIPGHTYTATHTVSGKTGIDAYGAKTQELLELQANYVKNMAATHYYPTIDMAVAYDWAFDYMQPSDRSAIVDLFIQHHEASIAAIDPVNRRDPLRSTSLTKPGQTALPHFQKQAERQNLHLNI